MQPQPNALERLLPTAGGLLGSLVGGVIGGGGGVAAGAAVPGADLTGVPEVAGGAMGARLGSTAGAGIGGGIGQGLEDFATSLFHQQGAPKTAASAIPGIAASAGENALGNAAGEGLNWVGGKVLGGATDLLGSLAAKRGAQATTDQAASDATQAASDAATQAEAKANAYKNNYGSISDRLQRDLNLGTNAKEVDNMGFDSTDPTQMKQVSYGGLLLNSVYDNALKNADPVNISDEVLGPIKQAIANKEPTDSIGIPMRQALSDNNIPMDEGTLKSLPATQVRQLQQSIGTQIGNSQRVINNAELMGTHNIEEEANLKNLQDTYRQLGSKIKTPQVNQAIAGLTVTDAGKQALVSQYGDQLGSKLADTITNAKGADDLLKPMQQYTQMSQAADMATNDMNNAIATPRAVARTKADIPATVAAPKPGINGGSMLDTLALGAAPFTHGASLLGLLPHALQAAGNPTVQDAALSGLKSAGASNIVTKVLPALTKLGAIGASNVPNEEPQPNPAMSDPNGQSNQTTGGAGVQPQLSPLEQFVLQQQQLQGGMAVQEEKAPMLASSLAGPMASMGSTVGGLMPQVQQQMQAAPVLQNLETNYQNAGGAQGPVGGLMSQASALIPGSPAAQYQKSQTAAAATLAQLLHINLNEAMQILPQLTNTGATAAGPQNAIQSLQGSMGPSGGQASLLGGL